MGYKTGYKPEGYRKSKKEALRNSLLRKALLSGRYWARTSDLQLVELDVGPWTHYRFVGEKTQVV